MKSETKLKQAMTEQLGRTMHEYYEYNESNVPDYLVIQMSILENLPDETQRLITGVLEEIADTFDMSDAPAFYQVNARGENPKSKMGPGAFIADPFKDKSPPKLRKR